MVRRTSRQALKPVDPATEQAQAAASNPAASAWVSANAGSGKTFVLARRVERLLLAGNDPGRILCLTFTKAAAAEMAKRVFKDLAEWTAMDDETLAATIRKIEGRRPDAAMLAVARRLFARALETPGGLKIQTIHAFCERLLHQFPFEANVAGHFTVLDEGDAGELKVEARKRVLADIDRDHDGSLGRALAVVLDETSDIGHDAAIAEFIDKRDRLRSWIVDAETLERGLADLRRALGLADGDTVAGKRGLILSESAFSRDDLAEVLVALRRSGPKDIEAGGRLTLAVEAADDDERIDGYLDFFTTTNGDLRKTSSLVTKSVKNRIAGLEEKLEAERDRLATALDGVAAAQCFETSAAMLRLADAAIGEYGRLKNAAGVLDFEDLIVKTVALLSRSDASRWIQYKLDRGIDHILVDEAQDTSPRQWQVIQAVAEEFFAGEGWPSVKRTLFAVGDEKQSIFSFQGAVPAWFGRMQGHLGGRARAANLHWADVRLHLSFRSTPAVLTAVDKVFDALEARKGVVAGGDWPAHAAYRHEAPGRVTVWPMMEPAEKQEAEEWWRPLDQLGDESPEVRLAKRIARTIRRWLDNKEVLAASGEPIRPGGILVLVRTRGALTDAINRALKNEDIPIAGADRLALTDHIAVMDLIALGRVMILPEDDLSLAALLKSPLIGLDEDQLYALAHGRNGTLWKALGESADEWAKHARQRIEDWRSLADYLDPYAFFARVLGPDAGRRSFYRRLGAEAEDALDEFLSQALAYADRHASSLEGFLAWLDTAETEIKRDAELLRNEVRVMTVHGAKGLEADVVFLVDNGTVPVHQSHDPKVLAIADETSAERQPPLVWMRSSKVMPPVMKERIKTLRIRSAEEYRRLLYVGMTRAKDRLIVCGIKKLRGTDEEAGWHALVSSALTDGCRVINAPDGSVEAWEWGPPDAKATRDRPAQRFMDLKPPLPAWIDDPVAAATAVPRFTPSTAQGETEAWRPSFAVPPKDAAVAMERGRVIHRLLQSLPDIAPAERLTVAARYLDAVAAETKWSADERREMAARIVAILDDPAHAELFATGSRAEVDIAGTIDVGGAPVALSGRIDRLAVTPAGVTIVDYKTNRPAPDTLAAVPAEYVLQLALYRALLGRIFPGREVSAAILWTAVPRLMKIPLAMLENAFASMASRHAKSAPQTRMADGVSP